MGEIILWRWLASALLTANLVMVGIMYRGAMKRLSNVEALLSRFIRSTVMLTVTLNPEKVDIIMVHFKDFVGGDITRGGSIG